MKGDQFAFKQLTYLMKIRNFCHGAGTFACTLLLSQPAFSQQTVPIPSASSIAPGDRTKAIMESSKQLNEAWLEFLTSPEAQERARRNPWMDMALPRILTKNELKQSVSGPEFQEPDVVRSEDGKLTVTLKVALADNKVGKDPVRLRNYNGKLTGPTLICKPGDTLYITVDNQLEPEPYMPGSMDTLHGFNTTNLHTHGLHVSPSGNSDNVLLEVEPQSSQRYEIAIPKDHPCGSFWYHAHEHGSTAANVGSGMSGALIIEGGIDELPGLKGIKDRVFVLQQLPYVNNDNAAVCGFKPGQQQAIGVVEAEYAACCFGPGTWDQLQRYTTINGQQIPVIRMKPGSIERWRFIDSAVREVIRPGLRLQEKSNPDAPASIPFQEIAVDGLPLGRIAQRDQLELWPGYRSDVLVQAPANAAGAVYILHDYRAISPPPAGVPVKHDRKHLAILVIEGEPVKQSMPDPVAMAPFRPTSISPTEVTGREFAAYGIIIKDGKVHFTVDRRSFGDDEARQLQLGDVDEWSLTSHSSGTSGGVSHPFHIHVNPFEIFSITNPQGEEQLDIDPKTAQPIPLWRDTVILNEGWKVMARSRYTDFTGTFVQHCHILDHEDQGMMELIQINEKPAPKMAMNKAVPLRPYSAPAWTLPDEKGREQSLAALSRSHPSLLVFFEGFSCIRCNEQIQQLITQIDAFKKAGVNVIAVSTDTVESLAQTLSENPCPFPMVADPKLSAFRDYGCAMGREPMHGLFLVDRQGKVRWQAVTSKPYMDWERVFAEAGRLTSEQASRAAVTTGRSSITSR